MDTFCAAGAILRGPCPPAGAVAGATGPVGVPSGAPF